MRTKNFFCIPKQFCIFCLRPKFSEVSIPSCLYLDTHKCRYFFLNGYPIKLNIKSKVCPVTLIWRNTSQSKQDLYYSRHDKWF